MVSVLSASSIASDKVKNLEGEDLGKIEELMIDLKSGRVAYAVVSFGAGFMAQRQIARDPMGLAQGGPGGQEDLPQRLEGNARIRRRLR